LVQNYKNLIKATEVCIYIAAEGVMMAKAIFMFFNQELIRGVLKDLQTMANESKMRLFISCEHLSLRNVISPKELEVDVRRSCLNWIERQN